MTTILNTNKAKKEIIKNNNNLSLLLFSCDLTDAGVLPSTSLF